MSEPKRAFITGITGQDGFPARLCCFGQELRCTGLSGAHRRVQHFSASTTFTVTRTTLGPG